jgi:hypothetical protein
MVFEDYRPGHHGGEFRREPDFAALEGLNAEKFPQQGGKL